MLGLGFIHDDFIYCGIEFCVKVMFNGSCFFFGWVVKKFCIVMVACIVYSGCSCLYHDEVMCLWGGSYSS